MKLVINKDKLTIDSAETTNSGSINYYEITTEFSSEWTNLTKEIVLQKEKEDYGYHRAVVDNKAKIDQRTKGIYYIGAIGYTITYALTTDTVVDTSKTYYTRTGTEGSYVYTKVINPVASALNTYYEATKTLQISTDLKKIIINKGAGEIEVEEDDVPEASTWQSYISQVNSVVTGAANLNVIGERVSDGVEITFTDKQGTQTVKKVNDGATGPAGPGVASGGTTGQVLKKKSGTDYDTEWADETGGGSEEDNVSITKNASQKIQAIGVIDQKTSNANKQWTGTKAEYNAISVKDENTIYIITDEAGGGSSVEKENIFRYTTMPIADSSNVGKIVEYIGTTGTYTKGYFYENVHTEIQESITAEETDNLGLLDNINVNATTFKSKVNGGGTYVFVKKGYPTKLTYMNLNNMVSYSVTRDTIFDNATLGIYSWVDDSNNYYITDTLRPNAGTKLYSYDINTEETTDTGASYLNSNTPSATSGYWTIQTSANVYEDVDLSEYGITMATSGFPGNEITVTYVEANDTYSWQQINVQPSGGSGGTSDFDQLTNRPKYNGTTMSNATNIPEVKTSIWDAKQDALTAGSNIEIENNIISVTGITSNYLGKASDYTQENPLNLDNLEIGDYLLYFNSELDNLHMSATFNGNTITGYFFPGDVTQMPLHLHIYRKTSSITEPGVIGYLSKIYVKEGAAGTVSETHKEIKLTASTIQTSSGYQYILEPVLREYDQTVDGKKTFTTLPESSVTPTTDNQLVNKKYVDDSVVCTIPESKGVYSTLAELETVTANIGDYGYVAYSIDNDAYLDKYVLKTNDIVLPTGYTRLKYIEGNGGSYIDTNVPIQSTDFKITTEYELTELQSHEMEIISTWTSTYDYFNIFISENTPHYLYTWWTSGTSGTSLGTFALNQNHTVVIDGNDGIVKTTLDGVKTVTVLSGTIPTTNPTTLKVFARGDGAQLTKGRLSYLKIEIDGETIHQFIPCLISETNKIGLYDTVEEIFMELDQTYFTAGAAKTASWELELRQNNDSFTSTQWAAINSGITTTSVAQINTNKRNINTKQDIIPNFLKSVSKDETNKYITLTDNNDMTTSFPYGGGSSSAVWGSIGGVLNEQTDLVEYVNSSISTSTATFKGTFDDLQELLATEADANDYAFYDTTDSSGNKIYDRYKYSEIESTLPTGYTQLDYILSEGSGAYIDTLDPVTDSYFEIDAEIMPLELHTGENPLYSTWTSSYKYWNVFAGTTGTLGFYWEAHLSSDANLYTVGSKHSITTKMYYDRTRSKSYRKLIIDNFPYESQTDVKTTNATSLKIFSRGDLDGYTKSRFYSLKVYTLNQYDDNKVLKHNYIPCLNTSTNKVGVYDAVDGEFFSSAGNREFTAGPNAGGWKYEYTLNNSSFTAAQWATINSGLTAESLETITTGATLGATSIQPNSNITLLNNNAGYITSSYHDSTKEDTFRYSTMPTADSSNVGKIVEYVGTTDTYTQGYFYKCISDGAETPTYSWQQINVQPSGGSGGTSDFDQLTNRPKYNGTTMSSFTNIPEVKTSTWDAKQDTMTASDNIIISNDAIKTKDSQIEQVDCTSLSIYNIPDEKIYIFSNITTLEITVTGNSERHFFVVCGSTAPTITTPDWGDIPFEANTTVEISVLNGKAVYKVW